MNTNLYIISGCNGAGKTTASFTILPEILNCKEFVNADEIAKGLSPFNPESVGIESGRIMLERIEGLLKQQEDFAFETTLSARSYKNKILDAQKKGYKVTLLFFWLRSSELAIERVKKRVSQGGNNIPDDVILRRYIKGIKNLFELYIPVVNEWIIVDNSEKTPIFIARTLTDGSIEIIDAVKWEKIKEISYGKE